MRTTFTKTLMAALVSAMALLFAVGCGEKEPPVISVSGVSINQTNITVKEGESQSLSATVSPSDAQNKAVSWSSSNSSVATVDNSGRVTGVKAGSATITVTTSDGGKTATCSVTVEAKIIAVSGVALDKDKLEIPVGGEATLAATVAPADATDKSVTWTSSDEAVAKVSGGKVTAVAAGKATITVKTTDGGKTATCEVTVTTPVASVELSLAETEVKVEGEVTLEATVAPEDATVKDLEWSSSDEAVAKVDATGKVTGVAEGEATITVKTKDGGKTATCKVTVTPKEIPVEEVAFEEAEVTVTEGESAKVSVSFTPAGATNKAVTYKSSDESVATVDAEGNVSALKPGKATITVTTEDGGKTATCEVTVEKAPVKVTGVTLNYKERTITIGNAGTLIATVQPEDAANKKVTWSSSDESIVKVGQDGALTPRKEGTATITVTTEDGGFTATCEVTATAKVVAVSSVKLDKSSQTIYVGDETQLKATVSPANATNPDVVWTSSKPAVATVDDNGKVKAVSAGSTTITAKSNNGKTGTCSVTVKDAYTIHYNGKEVTENSTINAKFYLEGDSPILEFEPYNLKIGQRVYSTSLPAATGYNSSIIDVDFSYRGGAGGMTAYVVWKVTPKKIGSTSIKLSVGGVIRTFKISVADANYSWKFSQNASFSSYSSISDEMILNCLGTPNCKTGYYRLYNEDRPAFVTGNYSSRLNSNRLSSTANTSTITLTANRPDPNGSATKFTLEYTMNGRTKSKIISVYSGARLGLSKSSSEFNDSNNLANINFVVKKNKTSYIYLWYNSTGTDSMTGLFSGPVSNCTVTFSSGARVITAKPVMVGGNLCIEVVSNSTVNTARINVKYADGHGTKFSQTVNVVVSPI